MLVASRVMPGKRGGHRKGGGEGTGNNALSALTLAFATLDMASIVACGTVSMESQAMECLLEQEAAVAEYIRFRVGCSRHMTQAVGVTTRASDID